MYATRGGCSGKRQPPRQWLPNAEPGRVAARARTTSSTLRVAAIVTEITNVLSAIFPVRGPVVHVALDVALVPLQVAAIRDPLVPGGVALELVDVVANVALVLPDVTVVTMNLARILPDFSPVVTDFSIRVQRGRVLRARNRCASDHQGRDDRRHSDIPH